MGKKVCVVAMSLMLSFLVGNSFAGPGSLSFDGTGQDACGLINGDDPYSPSGECEACDNGCGSSFIYYDLNLKVGDTKVSGKLEWQNCWKDDGIVTCNAWEESKLTDGRLLEDKKFGNTYISFAVTSKGPTDTTGCPSAVFRDYFMLLAIKDASGNIIGLEGGATAFEDEDCVGWSAAEIQRVVLHSY